MAVGPTQRDGELRCAGGKREARLRGGKGREMRRRRLVGSAGESGLHDIQRCGVVVLEAHGHIGRVLVQRILRRSARSISPPRRLMSRSSTSVTTCTFAVEGSGEAPSTPGTAPGGAGAGAGAAPRGRGACSKVAPAPRSPPCLQASAPNWPASRARPRRSYHSSSAAASADNPAATPRSCSRGWPRGRARA